MAEREHLPFDFEALGQVRFTVFVLVSKVGVILQENMAGCIWNTVGLCIFWSAQQALEAEVWDRHME